MPCGIVCQAQVQGSQDGPDGRYVLLSPWRSSVTLAVREEDLALPGIKAAAHREPAENTYILLSGTILSRFKTEGREGYFVLPLEWILDSPPPRMPWGDGPPPWRPGG